MAIESYGAAQRQLALERNSVLFPGVEIVIGIAKKALSAGGLELPAFMELSFEAIRSNSTKNLAYLFGSLVQDVERIDLKLDAFENAGKIEREALNELVSEGVVRAAEAKSEERVRRIARVLANTLRGGPKQSYEAERELIDAAAQIGESDTFILGTMMKHQGTMVKSSGLADINGASDTWKKMMEEHKEFTDAHIHVSCARLQSQGLIIRMDRKTSTLDLATNAYSLTTFGVQFCEWCLQEASR
jgi:hypothetical protein